MPAGSIPLYYNEALPEVAGFFPNEQQAKDYLGNYGAYGTGLQSIYGNQFLNVGANLKDYIGQRQGEITKARAAENAAYKALNDFNKSITNWTDADRAQSDKLSKAYDDAANYRASIGWGTKAFPGTQIGKYGEISPGSLAEKRPYYQQPTPWAPVTTPGLTTGASVTPYQPNVLPFGKSTPTPLPPVPTATPSPTTVPNFGIGSPLPGVPPISNFPAPNQIPSITPATPAAGFAPPGTRVPVGNDIGPTQPGKGTPWGGLLYNYPFNPYKPVSSGEPAIGSGNQALQSLMDKSKDLFSGGIPGGVGAGGGAQNWMNMF